MLVRPAHSQLLAAPEYDRVSSAHQGPELTRPADIHDRRPVDPNESVRTELALQTDYRSPDEKAAAIGVDADVVVFGRKPVDVRNVNPERAPAIANDQLRRAIRGAARGVVSNSIDGLHT